MSRPDDEDFLSRWSARKLKARSATAPEPAPAEAPSAEARLAEVPPTEADPDKTDAEILEELGLPDPDSLVKGDDFKAFLRAGIPARLRARALRRLWLSDPVLANLDGLNDYEQDFTDKATVRPDLKTAYRVGKGLLRDAPPGAADEIGPASGPPAERPTKNDVPAAVAEDAPPDRGLATSSGAEAETGQHAEPADAASAEETVGAPADPAPRARRMRFSFEAG